MLIQCEFYFIIFVCTLSVNDGYDIKYTTNISSNNNMIACTTVAVTTIVSGLFTCPHSYNDFMYK